MDSWKLVTVVGTAVTTFLVAGAATIEAITAAVGGEIGPGIVGVFVGVALGLVAAAVVGRRYDVVAGRTRTALHAYAAFGLTLLVLAFLSYVNTPGVDAYLDLTRNLVIAAAVAVLVAVGTWRRVDRATVD